MTRPDHFITAVLVCAGLATTASPVTADRMEPLVVPSVTPPITPSAAPQDETEGVATSDVPRVALTADGASSLALEVGQPFVVTVQPGADVVGFDGLLAFDPGAVEYGGAGPTSAGTALAENSVADGHVRLAAYVEPGETAAAAAIEVRLITRVAGQVGVTFDVFDAVDAGGTTLAAIPTLSTVVDVAGDATVIDAPDPSPAPNGDTAATELTAADVDVTGDGVVDSLDVTEVQSGWDELTATGAPCATDNERLRHLDVNEDGCLGVEDLTAVASAAIPSEPAAVATAQLAVVEPFVVNVTHDGQDNQLKDGRCISNLGGCSLRAAMLQANATTGPNEIRFDIPGPGPHTITISDQLPTLNDGSGGTVIDGYSQPGATANEHPFESRADIRIIIRPDRVVSGRTLLGITSPDNEIRGLSLLDQSYKVALRGDLATRNRIVGNFIGTDPAGTAADPSNSYRIGVRIVDGANANVIGAPDLADRNVISGNSGFGVRIEQNDSDHTVIQNNILGLSHDGRRSVRQGGGVDVQFGPEFTQIGGSARYEHNVFSGNVRTGIDFSHNSFNNVAVGNYIGTDLTGTTGFSHTANYRGFWIKDDSRFNVIRDNVIANNETDGVLNRHNYTGRNTYIDNRIGVTLDGSPLGNGGNGIFLRGHDDIIMSNVIANNGEDGIRIESTNDIGANDDELTERNRISENIFYVNGQSAIDITDGESQGSIRPPTLDAPTVGRVEGSACGGCQVEVYLADGGEGRVHLGSTTAAVGGRFAFDDARLVAGVDVTALAIDAVANTSEFATARGLGTDGASWAQLTGSFSQTSVDGTPVAYTCDQGRINNGGADSTTSFVYFDLVAPATGQYRLEAVTYARNSNSNSFWVTIDGQGGNGYLWDVPNSRSLTSSLVSDRDGAVPVVVDLAAGSHRIGVAMREDGTGIATMSLGPVGVASGTAPTIGPVGARAGKVANATSLQLSATPAGVMFWALNLPDGLTIDARTGTISGRPIRAGTFPVSVWATNVAGTSATAFDWVISVASSPPVLEAIADQTSTVGDSVSLQVTANDPNGDRITYSATGLPAGVGIDPNTGVISGTIEDPGLSTTTTTTTTTITAADGSGSTSVSLVWTIEPGFACVSNGSALDWTDIGAGTYYIRLRLNGNEAYLGSTAGTTFDIPSRYGRYQVVAYVNGRRAATCAAPGGVDAPSFECSVTGSTLSWTDIGAGRYYVRLQVDGAEAYVGSANGTSYVIPSQYGTYQVVAYTVGRQTTSCTAPGGADASPFECSVTGSTLSWTDQGIGIYYIRYTVDGQPSIYLGSTTTLDYPTSAAYGTYTVVGFTPIGRLSTNCDAPGGATMPGAAP